MTHFDFAFEPPGHSPDRPGGEPQHIGEIEKLISELSDREKQDLYILLLIAQREGWSLWTTNKEMGYFPLDMPLIEAHDRSSRSQKQWLYFFWLQNGKPSEQDAQLNL